MAANYVTVTPALAKLISSLSQDAVPFKLRCAICSKLAVNAFKTPCCEQMICENCKLTLPSTCPVCEHTPVSAEDCKPNNKLRMTTRAFLKTAEKKRDSSQAKESTPITPITPSDAKPSTTPAPLAHEAPADAAPADATAPAQEHAQLGDVSAPAAGQDAAVVEQDKEAQTLAEDEDVPADDQRAGEVESQDDMKQVGAGDEPSEEQGAAEAIAEEPTDDGESKTIDSQQNPSFPNAFAFGGMNGQLPNMTFGNGDLNQMNQMQMMMAMQNGMQNGMNPNGFGFPMMGMPGMGMDPSLMNMYQMNNGFGAPGMDMSMMNGGMGGFNGGVGSEENWNGPQSWNNGQNNYNHPNASGMGNGDYGNFNSGYHTGFNQGNFGQHNQFNDFRGRGYFRGRGRGRGYGNFGRGGYGYGQQGNFQGQNHMNQQYQQHGLNTIGQGPNVSQSGRSVSSGDGQAEGDTTVDEYGRTLRAEPNQSTNDKDAEKTEGSEAVGETGDKDAKTQDTTGPDAADASGQQTSAIETVQPSPDVDAIGNVVLSQDSRIRTNGPPFGPHRRGGSFGNMAPPPAPAPDVPLNAPKGPKAMRQGLPNTSLLNLRARGYQIPGAEPSRVLSPGVRSGQGGLATPVDEDRDHRRSRSNSIASTVKRRSGESEHQRERERSTSRARTDRDKERERTRDRRDRDREGTTTRSTSRSRSREHRERKRKHRSEEEDDRDYDKDRRHRHRSSKKHYDDDEPRASREDKYGERSRSASPAGSRKSGHRSSRKERDSEKRRERDRDRDHDRDRDRDRVRESEDDREHKRKSTHRSSHRDRDRSDRDRSDRDKDRKRDRDRDHRDEKRRSKHSTAELPTPTELSADKEVKEFNPPTGPRGSISKNYSIFNAPKPSETTKAASSSSRTAPSSAAVIPPKGPAADRNRRSGQTPSSTNAAATAKDPHAAEREARNRERLLKETQRLAGMGGGGGGGGGVKRRGDDAADAGGRSKRKRRGGEVRDDVGGGEEEARMKRLEAEREGSRWG